MKNKTIIQHPIAELEKALWYRVDRLVSEHLRSETRSSPHTLFL
jgi:hypothetical protein